MEGAIAALAMRLVRSMNFLRVFSHEAAEPPLGPIITPRYSAEGTNEKLAHSGVIFLTALVTRLIASGVGLPRHVSHHQQALRYAYSAPPKFRIQSSRDVEM